MRAEGSVWCDAYAAPYPFFSDPNDQWHGARHFYHLSHTDPNLANGYTPFCYDEICEADIDRGLYDRATWKALAERCTVPCYAAVAFTFTPTVRDVVLGIRDGHDANPASKLYVAHEFFYFGEDDPSHHEYQVKLVAWYATHGMASYLVPCFNVANAPHKNDRAYRAFSYNPGTVYGYWLQTINLLLACGAPRDAWVWGSGYKRPTEGPGQGAAVRALDLALARSG